MMSYLSIPLMDRFIKNKLCYNPFHLNKCIKPLNKVVELPDIGDFDEVEIIEILVSKGDDVSKDDSLITLESDKASMEIPSPFEGKVADIKVSIGDKISKGHPILEITTESEESIEDKQEVPSNEIQIQSFELPDIGDFDEVEIIEILVSDGDKVEKDDSLLTLESDKASMEIPSPYPGLIIKSYIRVGDMVSKGSKLFDIETSTESSAIENKSEESQPEETIIESKPASDSGYSKPNFDPTVANHASGSSHASPSVRKLARELGVNLSNVVGTGPKGRILELDLKGYVKQILTSGNIAPAIPKVPVIDYSKFGEIETIPLSKINKVSGKHLTACWLNVPHVTQFDEVNIELMEAYRKTKKEQGIKLTPLVFIMKAVVSALKIHPRLNSSLDETGENIIHKKFFNLGIAMDTKDGLVVPVIKDVDKKSLEDLAEELKTTSERARAGKLTLDDMQGGGFSISSLGGIGGTQFTPIVNAPEVAILGLSKTEIKPKWNGKEFIPVPILPLALSYDHRVIDGAQGARFITELNSIIQNITEDLS